MPYTDSRLKAGKLRHRVQIVKPYGPSQDAVGFVSMVNMSPVITTWASIEAITGKDVLATNQFSSEITHKITIRYRGNLLASNPATITAKDQVWFNNRVFQIEAVLNPDERNKTLYLLCVELNDSVQQVTNQPGDLT